MSRKKLFNLHYYAIQKFALLLLPHSAVNQSNQLSPRSITKSHFKKKNHLKKIIDLKAFYHLKPSWIHAEQFWILA